MNRIFFIIVLTAAVAGFQADTARAQAQPARPQIVITMVDSLIQPVARDSARKTLRDTNGSLISRPGDVIRYILTAANKGGEAAYNVEIVDPIPAGTQYVSNSARGENTTITYSIDHGTTYDPKPMIEVRNEKGEVVKKPAPPEMYTHVKWLVTVPIQPAKRATAEFEVRVNEK